MTAENVIKMPEPKPRLHCVKCHTEGPAPCNCGVDYITADEAKERRQEFARDLYRQGQTQAQIAETLRVSQQQVSRDLADFDLLNMSNSKRPKTASNPKGAGRPKGSTGKTRQSKRGEKMPKLDDAVKIIRPAFEAGSPINCHKLAEQHPDISHYTFDSAVAYLKGERDTKADPEIKREDLSMTAQHRLDAAIRQHQKKLDAAWQSKLTEAVLNWGRNIKFPEYEKYLADAKRVLESRGRGGIMSAASYNLIRRCLHPDNSASEKNRNDAFDLWTNLRAVVTSHEEMPIKEPKLPTWEEMQAMRAAKRAENSARSKAAHAKRAAANGVERRH
jgi:hypothetical protein